MTDSIVVEMILHGDIKDHRIHAREGRLLVPLYMEEREEAVRKLHARGLNDVQISKQTNMSARTVLRIRQRLGLPTNVPESLIRRSVWVESDPKLRCGASRSSRPNVGCQLRSGHESDPELPDAHMRRQSNGKWIVWKKKGVWRRYGKR